MLSTSIYKLVIKLYNYSKRHTFFCQENKGDYNRIFTLSLGTYVQSLLTVFIQNKELL